MADDGNVPPFFEGFMLFLVAVYAFEAYLDVRQRRKLLEKTVPAALAGVVTQEEFESARAYSLDKNGLTMLQEGVNTTATALFYLMGGLPWLWGCAGALLDACRLGSEGEMAQSLAFVALYYVQGTIQGLPWELYETFVVEERHGFNKQTFALFVTDQLKTHALFAILGTPTLAGLLAVIRWGGALFYVYAWGLVFVLLLFFLTVYPNVIAPMFNTFTPLAEGPLKKAIDDLAKLNKFPLKKLYCVDGSTRSSHSNAYFYGFGSNKRIVLYDTLCPELLAVEKKEGEKKAEKTEEEKAREMASSCTIEEIVAILAHELGHWKMSHTLCQLAVSQVHVFFFFFSLGYMLNSDGMYKSWGFKDDRAVIIGLILFSNVVSPVEHVIGFLQNSLTRRFEYQADFFAVQQGRGDALSKGLVKISKGNKSNLNPDWMHSAYHHTHPALLERLNAISKALKKRT